MLPFAALPPPLVGDTDWLIEVDATLLPRYGGTVNDVINCLSCERFERLTAPEGAAPFHALDADRAPTAPRFYVVAKRRLTSEIH